jgi:DNA-directed RNA polymerase subunit beta'
MVLGCYYLTANNPTQQTIKDQYFYSFDDVMKAYQQSLISLHTFVWVRYTDVIETELDKSRFSTKQVENQILYLSEELQIKTDLQGNTITKYLKTSPGRILLNSSFEYN